MSQDNDTALTLENKSLNSEINTLKSEINTLKSEIEILHRMSSEKDILIINMNHKLMNIDDQIKKLVEQNDRMETQLSRLMSYLVSFAVDVRQDLHHIKYK
jgi:chromosome segregation ATPase